MSQQKVENYKKQKANRREQVAKERAQRKMYKGLAIAIAVLIVGGISAAIGLTAYNEYKLYQENLPNYTAENALLVDDLAGVLEEETTAAAEEK